MTRVWIMTLEQIQAAFDIAQDSIDDPSAKGLMEACGKESTQLSIIETKESTQLSIIETKESTQLSIIETKESTQLSIIETHEAATG